MLDRNLRLPIEEGLGAGDIRAPNLGVVLGEGGVGDGALTSRQFEDEASELQYRELGRVPDVHRFGDIGIHEAAKAVHQI
ncbi:hypothetical protein D3C72_2037410 [compost metagenome]